MMKRFLVGLIMAICGLVLSIGVRAEEPRLWADRNGWEIVAGFQKSFNDHNKIIPDYYAINAGAGYRMFFFKGFNFNPQARLMYRKSDFNWSGGPSPNYEWDCLLSLRATVGYKWKMLELYSGPTADTRLFHCKWKKYGDDGPYPVVMAWQFGVGADLTRGFAVRFDFNLPVTKFDRMFGNMGLKYFEVSVAYRL